MKVAVLDTGIDLHHVDFQGRVAASESFVGQPVQDGNGHGTHTAGTAYGPKESSGGIRYGIAYDAELYIGKVLRNENSTTNIAVMSGIEWALAQGCRVISMSLGGPTSGTPDMQFEMVGRRALLDHNAVIIAAAGNRSRRSIGQFAAVDSPADCLSFMAVGAMARDFTIGDFSARTKFPPGGSVNVIGPGVQVYSSWPGDTFRRIDGTSMATPHVAGIAALALEKYALTGVDLFKALTGGTIQSSGEKLVRPIPTLDTADAGAGLIQAPQ